MKASFTNPITMIIDSNPWNPFTTKSLWPAALIGQPSSTNLHLGQVFFPGHKLSSYTDHLKSKETQGWGNAPLLDSPQICSACSPAFTGLGGIFNLGLTVSENTIPVPGSKFWYLSSAHAWLEQVSWPGHSQTSSSDLSTQPIFHLLLVPLR